MCHAARLLDSTEAYDPFVGTAEYLSPELLRDEEAKEPADLWALGCIIFQMLTGSPPFQVLGSPHLTMEQIKAWPLEYHNPAALDALPEAARKLIVALLHPEPEQRLGATSEGYAGLKRHPFFTSTGSSDTHQPAPINFDELTSRPPPPLIPPPPLPSIMTDGSVLNGQLAKRGPLSPLERTPLLASQSGVRWSALLDQDSSELLVLSTLVTKRRHLSAKRRQLILAEGLLQPTAAASSPSGGAAIIAPRTPKAQNGSSSPQSVDSTPTTQLAAVDITDSSSSSSGASGGASGGSGASGGASGGGEAC